MSESATVLDWTANVIGTKLYTADRCREMYGKNINKKIFQSEALDIIRIWSHRKDFLQLDLSWLLEMVGDTDINYVTDYLERWFKQESDTKANQHNYSKIILKAFRNHRRELLATFSNWSKNWVQHESIIISSLKEMLKDIRFSFNGKVTQYDSRIRDLLNYIEKEGIKADATSLDRHTEINDISVKTSNAIEFIDSIPKGNLDQPSKNILGIRTELVRLQKEFADDLYVAGESFRILSVMSKRYNLDYEKMTREFNDGRIQSDIIKSFILIDAINKRSTNEESLDYENIMYIVKDYPNISGFLGTDWIEENCRKDAYAHPLLMWLSQMANSSKFAGLVLEFSQESNIEKKNMLLYIIKMQVKYRILVRHIDNCIGIFESKTDQGTKRVVAGLIKEEDFYQTMSQIEIALFLKRTYHIKVEDNSLGKPIDILAIKPGIKLIFEITSPDMIAGLKYSGFEADMRNKARDIICKKVDQLKSYINRCTDPIILVIDKTRAPNIDIEDVIDAFEGTPIVNLITNNATQEIVKTYASRKKDAIGLELENGHRLSAVILYSSKISLEESRVKLDGYIIPNRLASQKLGDDTIKELKNVLFS